MSSLLAALQQRPRVRLFEGPTPLQPMANLSQHYGSAQLWVKRDDLTELAFGGNKVRQLEFYFGQARAAQADTVLITGAVQSNFVRLAAAAANMLRMACHIQLEHRVPRHDSLYQQNGNVLLDKLLGATLYTYPEGEDEQGADKQLAAIAETLKQQGKKPYIIPLSPGHPPHGALGYVVAACELAQQLHTKQLTLHHIGVASGSGATHAGLLFGLRALGIQVPVTGICVRRAAPAQKQRILAHCQDIAELLALPACVYEHDLQFSDQFLAPGYGILGPKAHEAIQQAASLEGLFLDPTYTAKVLAGTLHIASQAPQHENHLFIHTGGTPALFAYEKDLIQQPTPD